MTPPCPRELTDLIRIPSHGGVPGARRTAAQLCKDLLTDAGFAVHVCGPQDAPSLIATIDADTRTRNRLLFYNHYDVVPPGHQADWRHPPFDAVIENGVLFGRGSSDHKASFVARLIAVRDLKQRGALPVGVTFLVDGEEEIGSPSLGQTIIENKALLAASGGLYSGGARNENGTMIIRAGSKGRCGLRLTVAYSASDNHSKWAPLLRNPGWRLVAALTSLHDGQKHILEGARTPDRLDEAALAQLSFDPQKFLREVGHDALRADAAADPLRSLMFAPTFNLAWINSGPGGGTVLPGRASALLDLRLVPGQSSAEVAARVRAHLARHGFDDIEVEETGGSEPDKCDLDDPVVQALTKAARDLGMPCLLHPMGAGSGPRHLFRRHLGFSLVQDPGCSWQGSNDHAADENILIEHFDDNRRLIEAFLVQSARHEDLPQDCDNAT